MLSHWFSPSTTCLSSRIFSKSRVHSSSSLVFSCFHTPSMAVGQYLAGVGKHALKFAYEFALIEDERAPANTFCNAAARGPGVAVMGACGGGEGDAETRSAIVCVSVWVPLLDYLFLECCCDRGITSERRWGTKSGMTMFIGIIARRNAASGIHVNTPSFSLSAGISPKEEHGILPAFTTAEAIHPHQLGIINSISYILIVCSGEDIVYCYVLRVMSPSRHPSRWALDIHIIRTCFQSRRDGMHGSHLIIRAS